MTVLPTSELACELTPPHRAAWAGTGNQPLTGRLFINVDQEIFIPTLQPPNIQVPFGEIMSNM